MDRCWLDFQSILGSKILKIHWFLQVFVKINIFDEDLYPRAIRAPKWNQKGAKMKPGGTPGHLCRQVVSKTPPVYRSPGTFLAILAPERSPRGPRNGAKIVKKSIQKPIETYWEPKWNQNSFKKVATHMIEVWIVPGRARGV